MNLTDANLQGPTHEPEWFEMYQAKKEYNLRDLSPKSVDDFFQRMLTDDELFQKYNRYVYREFNPYKYTDPQLVSSLEMRIKLWTWSRLVTVILNVERIFCAVW